MTRGGAMEHNESSQGDFESTLKKHAVELVESLEKGKFGDAVQLIHELNQTRDRGLYQEVGKLTRELHSAIVNFQIDPHMPQAEEISQITDATERLSYVVKLTEGAANRTMDLVEQSAPLVNDLSDEAQSLSADWGRFMRREMSADGFRELAKRVELFLARSERDVGLTDNASYRNAGAAAQTVYVRVLYYSGSSLIWNAASPIARPTRTAALPHWPSGSRSSPEAVLDLR